MSEVIQVKKENNIAYITMNRPDKLNALSVELSAQLNRAIREADEDPEVKVIILSGAGRAFCAGGDIGTFQQVNSVADMLKYMTEVVEIQKTIKSAKKYVISAVHGYAAGAGFSVALASDFIVAHQEAKFAISFNNIGLIPDLGLVKNLSEVVPPQVAKEWISSARSISAEEGYQRGFVNRIAENDVIEEATEFAQFIISGPPIANQFVKYLVNHATELTNETFTMQENTVQALLFQTLDHKEGVRAFFEKRKPEFKGE